MNTIKTKFRIGDLVYIVGTTDIDREVIKAIKIVSVQEKISYGIKESGGGWGLLGSIYGNSDYRWYSATDIFTDLKAAEARQKTLQAKEAEKETASNQKEILDLEHKLRIDQENLRRKKAGLPELEDDEDCDE